MMYLNRILAFITRNVKKIIILAAVMLILALFASVSYNAAYHFARGDKNIAYDENGKSVMLTIPKGSSSEQIAEILEENGVIDNATRFRLRAMLMGTENSFKFGTYTFTVGMPDEKIMDVLMAGAKQEELEIVIPEGWTVEQIGEYLQNEEICMKEDFLKACNEVGYDFDFYTKDMLSARSMRRNRLEGYLFPNTYRVTVDEGAEGIAKRLLRQFEIEFNDSMMERAEELGLTVDQVVTMASVIEKEAYRDEERPKIAAVLYNRMKEEMPWQLNSTVLYALGIENKGEDSLTYDDLEVDSGYNTYKNKGYPTGPICNPGLESIKAALYPDDTDALYFVLIDEETGTHLFTADYDEFLAAREENGQ